MTCGAVDRLLGVEYQCGPLRGLVQVRPPDRASADAPNVVGREVSFAVAGHSRGPRDGGIRFSDAS